ncbi:hypothetical protein [Emticicia sp. BO119]|uniref:hypothetical protein n=1 Tax=Emticicia sp. BO119 TaxID=2757768 RepID=UPI0015F0C3AA|nr:hypothetical protein [Emticicia sp. BO119]MBA4849397.1 hypothetical protein [Emticicia sp. BO119]
MTSIWALRALFWYLVFHFSMMLFASLPISVPPIEKLFQIIIILVISIINIDLFILKSLVYLSENEITLTSVLGGTRSYAPKDFVRISVYNTWLSVTFIEFADGKKFHILTRENSYTPYNNHLFKNYTSIANELDRQVRDYLRKR